MNEPRRERGDRRGDHLSPPIREESSAAETSRADKLISTAEQRADHLINGTLASEDRRL